MPKLRDDKNLSPFFRRLAKSSVTSNYCAALRLFFPSAIEVPHTLLFELGFATESGFEGLFI